MNKKAILFGVLAFAVVLTAGVASAAFSGALTAPVQQYGYGYGYGYGYVGTGYTSPAQAVYGYGYDYKYVVVEQLFENLLGRQADLGAVLYYAGKTPAAIVASIFTSNEYKANAINTAYTTVLGRAADLGGLNYYLGKMNAGWDKAQVEADMYSSAEYATVTAAAARKAFAATPAHAQYIIFGAGY